VHPDAQSQGEQDLLVPDGERLVEDPVDQTHDLGPIVGDRADQVRLARRRQVDGAQDGPRLLERESGSEEDDRSRARRRHCRLAEKARARRPGAVSSNRYPSNPGTTTRTTAMSKPGCVRSSTTTRSSPARRSFCRTMCASASNAGVAWDVRPEASTV